jgi:periplasmic divalent cation tolerance protein
MHPYEVPEIIALPIEKGLDQYIEWVLKETATH